MGVDSFKDGLGREEVCRQIQEVALEEQEMGTAIGTGIFILTLITIINITTTRTTIPIMHHSSLSSTATTACPEMEVSSKMVAVAVGGASRLRPE